MSKRKFFNGAFAILISQIIIKIFGIIYKLYLANKEGFGDSGNAIYNSGYQIFALILTVTTIGVPNAISKLVAERNNSYDKTKILEVLKSAIIIFSIIGVICGFFMAIFSSVIADKFLNIIESKYSIIALSPAVFNVCLISVFRGFFNGINRVEVTAKSQSIEQILKTVFTFIFVEVAFFMTSSNIIFMAAFANLATTFATLGSFIYLYKKNNLSLVNVKFRYSIAWKIIKVAIPISLSSILVSFNKNIDSFTIVKNMRAVLGSEEAKIQYGILSGKVEVIASMPISFIVAVSSTIVPKISKFCVKNSYKNYDYNILKLSKYYLELALLLILPCAILMYENSNWILTILFKSSSGCSLLKISSIALIFISLEQVIYAILQGLGFEFIPAISLLFGVGVKFILNVFAIKFPTMYLGLKNFSGFENVNRIWS